MSLNSAIRSLGSSRGLKYSLASAAGKERCSSSSSNFSFRQVTSLSSQTEAVHDMDRTKSQNASEKTGNVMSHSFGEGYATRADEDGFGGVYDGNQAVNNINADKEIHENHPAYDKTQGSEVKQKEKARHQTNASS